MTYASQCLNVGYAADRLTHHAPLIGRSRADRTVS